MVEETVVRVFDAILDAIDSHFNKKIKRGYTLALLKVNPSEGGIDESYECFLSANWLDDRSEKDVLLRFFLELRKHKNGPILGSNLSRVRLIHTSDPFVQKINAMKSSGLKWKHEFIPFFGIPHLVSFRNF